MCVVVIQHQAIHIDFRDSGLHTLLEKVGLEAIGPMKDKAHAAIGALS